MATRKEIADALTTAGVVKGAPYKPSTLATGSAWPQGPTLDRVGGTPAGFFQETWSVFIVLPSGDEAASRWWDTNIGAIYEALAPVLYVERIEPVLIPVGLNAADVIPAMLITARSEQ